MNTNIINSFKKEFKRLGNPSALKYEKLRDKTNSPPISHVKRALNVELWSDVLNKLDLKINDKRSIHRQKYTDVDETLEKLKQEIIRLGIQNKPKIEEYRKHYQRGIAPSTSTLFNLTGKTWLELMHQLGFDYKTDTTKYHQILSDKEKIINQIIDLMHEKNILNSTQVRNQILPKLNWNYSSLVYHGIDWNSITTTYQKKFNTNIKKRHIYKSKRHLDLMPADQLLTEVFKIIDGQKLTTLKDDWFVKPSYAKHRFGTSDLKKLRSLHELIKG